MAKTWLLKAVVPVALLAMTAGGTRAEINKDDFKIKTVLLNNEGATAPCVGVDIYGAIKKCISMFQDAGFVREAEVGVSGLTVGTAGKDDGKIVSIDPSGPAAQAGLQAGDQIVSIENKQVRPTPGIIAKRVTFGPHDSELHMKLLRNGASVEVHLIRAAHPAPDAPPSPGRFYMYRPLIDWRGDFIPCMGAGPAAPAAIAFCDDHFKPFGFIKIGDYGITGFQLDLDNPDAAVIKSVDADSPAAKADIRPGDVITEVEGKPLTASLGESANQMLFGKTGVVLHLQVLRGNATQTFAITLADKAKK